MVEDSIFFDTISCNTCLVGVVSGRLWFNTITNLQRFFFKNNRNLFPKKKALASNNQKIIVAILTVKLHSLKSLCEFYYKKEECYNVVQQQNSTKFIGSTQKIPVRNPV
ncbi:MAG: hypothetical protein OJF59_002194 [Cytophagales bacterium]|nr:MAG: hypothetical protein OJF59_002194 [Cytophagales bacterium]